MFDFAQEMGDLKLALKEVSVTQQISFLVLIYDAKTWSLKKRNKTVSDTGLSLCTDWVFDFLQEMGDLKLTLKGIGVTQQISSLVLICDATTWFPNKRNKTVSDTGHWTVCRRKNLYYNFLLLLKFHSFVSGVYFLVFISVLC